jgi:hypothetical protein
MTHRKRENERFPLFAISESPFVSQVTFHELDRELPATTVAGLALKGRLARFDLSNLYDGDEHDDCGVESFRALIDGVLDLAAGGK